MKRRDFVKGLGATQLAMMTSRFTSAMLAPMPLSFRGANAISSSIQRLNVVVHGMFTIVLDTKGKLGGGTPSVYLRAPQVYGPCSHSYRAQAFIPDGGNPDNVIQVWSKDYEVMTARTKDMVNVARSANSSLSVQTGEPERLAIYVGKKGIKTDPFWTVVLPVPDDLWPLREAPFNYFNGNTYINAIFNATYKNNGMSFYQKMPMVYVLSYTKLSSDKVIFTGNNQEVPVGSDGVVRLHFYAEPPSECTDLAHTALDALDTMFDSKLTLQFDPELPDPDEPLGRDSSIPAEYVGVRLAEERSLSERQQFPDKKPNLFKEKVVVIQKQYSKFFEYRGTLKTQDDRKMRNALAPGDLKPPSNCMSVIGTME